MVWVDLSIKGEKVKGYLPTKECVKCRGACCKHLPAPYTPKDVVRIFGNVEGAIKSNLIAIDWWEADEPLYFIRPKVKEVSKLYDASWGGECIHLTESGCALPREKMPTFCKILKPRENGGTCSDGIKKHNSKYVAGLLWKRLELGATRGSY